VETKPDPAGAPDGSSIDGEIFKVLVNDAGQHSIWPAGKDAPAGWHAVGPVGAKPVCTAWIEAAWTDMRPKAEG
jgi:MbtH protein